MSNRVTVRAKKFEVVEIVVRSILVFVVRLKDLWPLPISAVCADLLSAGSDQSLPGARFSSTGFSVASVRAILETAGIQFINHADTTAHGARLGRFLTAGKFHLAAIGAKRGNYSTPCSPEKCNPALLADPLRDRAKLERDYPSFYLPSHCASAGTEA